MDANGTREKSTLGRGNERNDAQMDRLGAKHFGRRNRVFVFNYSPSERVVYPIDGRPLIEFRIRFGRPMDHSRMPIGKEGQLFARVLTVPFAPGQSSSIFTRICSVARGPICLYLRRGKLCPFRCRPYPTESRPAT